MSERDPSFVGLSVERLPFLRQDFVGTGPLRPTASSLVDAYDQARPSVREVLGTRSLWPVGFEAERADLGGVLYLEGGPSSTVDEFSRWSNSSVKQVDAALPPECDGADIVLELLIDFVDFGLAAEEASIRFASLLDSSSEVRLGSVFKPGSSIGQIAVVH